MKLSHLVTRDRSWKRVRYAVSPREMAEIADFLGHNNGAVILAIRGIPLVLEDNPTQPEIKVIQT